MIPWLKRIGRFIRHREVTESQFEPLPVFERIGDLSGERGWYSRNGLQMELVAHVASQLETVLHLIIGVDPCRDGADRSR